MNLWRADTGVWRSDRNADGNLERAAFSWKPW
jgi:hypothetical protein